MKKEALCFLSSLLPVFWQKYVFIIHALMDMIELVIPVSIEMLEH